MAKTDKMSKAQLKKAKADAVAQLKELEKAEANYDARRLKELKAEIQGMLAKEGYTLAQLAGGVPGKKSAKSKAPAKYQHPENISLTWSGRGRQPAWFKEHIDNGGKAEDIAI